MSRMITVMLSLMVLLASVDALASLESALPDEVALTQGQELSLLFNAPVDIVRSRVWIYGPHGVITVNTLEPGDVEGELIVPLPDRLPPGLYLIEFSAFTRTGDDMSGATPFTVPERSAPITLPNLSLGAPGR